MKGHHGSVPNLSQQRQNPSLVALGAAVRLLREQHGLSQEALALKAEVDRSYLGRIERGDNNAAILTLQRVANSLNVTLAELLAAARL